MSETYDNIYSHVMREGGNEIYSAKIIIEWYPEIFSLKEYTDARNLLKENNIDYVGDRQIAGKIKYTRKFKTLLSTSKNRPGKKFSEVEKFFIKEHFKTMSIRNIARKTGRSVYSIEQFVIRYRERLNLGSKPRGVDGTRVNQHK